jgi:hypothetical protein
MKKHSEMLSEYDFSKGVRGKYAQAYHEGVNIVKIDDDVTKIFPDSKSVNEALRTLMRLLASNHKTAQSA